MEWFSAPDYRIARLLIERGLGLVYLLAFVAALDQFPALLGERGLLPVPQFLARTSFRRDPSIFHLSYSDRLLRIVGWCGVAGSLATILGLPQAGPLWLPMLVWLVLWILYLSIVNVGQLFYSFGWESLLLEAGFLAIFLGNSKTAPPLLVLLLFRWVAIRLELGAGLIKLRGDPCWRDLTCMDYHHETQPMPNPLSWYFHRLPRALHKAEVVGNYVAQLIGPFAMVLPQPIAAIGALVMFATQSYLLISGNYAFLNLLTLITVISAMPDDLFHRVLAVSTSPPLTSTPLWFVMSVCALTVLVIILSYQPIRNMVGRRQLMNYSFNRLHLVNTYGAFGSVTRQRHEVIVEGTDEGIVSGSTTWRPYEFRGKPGDVDHRPPQVGPYHQRLSWLMWFVAISPSYAGSWFMRLLARLLENDRPTTRLLRRNPFPDAPPKYVRALLYRYRFTTWPERRATGAWWVRERVGELVGPRALKDRTASRQE